MPPAFTATSVVWIPKKPLPSCWSDYRPISLCNVTNKIMSKILNARLASVLPLIISPNQSGFVQGWVISDNILLAQELIHDLHVSDIHDVPNLALKLDMAKVYDRVHWQFLREVLVRMGFPDRWILLIRHCVENCTFSILVNSSPAGYFASSRGLRQGDPISPSLFVLAADYLSRCLDRFITDHPLMRYRTVGRPFAISHLSYADDIIIFTRAVDDGLVELMRLLDHYSMASGQMISIQKSTFILAPKHAPRWHQRVHDLTGFRQGDLPITYLGAPLYKGFMRRELFAGVKQRMLDRISGWSHRHLAFGGRLALIKSTLCTIPLHLLQVMDPPQYIIQDLEQIIARYFWGAVGPKRKTHWVSWRRICRPTSEGGLGIRSLSDMARAFSYKLWWRLRAGTSLWSQFMLRKYCFAGFYTPMRTALKAHASHPWRRLLRVGIQAQEFICWTLGSGSGEVSFWDDTWIGDRPLSSFFEISGRPHLRISDLWVDGSWDRGRVESIVGDQLGFSPQFIQDILATPIAEDDSDSMCWTLTSSGAFSLTSAWSHIRVRDQANLIYGAIWTAFLTPTISVFIWRLLQRQIPTDDILQQRGVSLASRCLCCSQTQTQTYHTETIAHLFLESVVAREVERHIALLVDAGLATSEFWTGCSPPPRFLRAIPIPARTHRPVPVVWLRPESPWIKLNTDGSFDRDTQIAGGGGLIRDHHGELLLAFHSSFQASSSFDAEIQALAVGLILAAQRSRYVWIELDAAAVVTLLTSGHRGSWQVRHTLMRIRHIFRDIQFRVTHIYREGNRPTDYLSELGMSSLGIQTYTYDTAPPFLLSLIRMDQLGYPSFRFR
ncbi:hypothetical protein OROMI_013758 [Orobanche minor]